MIDLVSKKAEADLEFVRLCRQSLKEGLENKDILIVNQAVFELARIYGISPMCDISDSVISRASVYRLKNGKFNTRTKTLFSIKDVLGLEITLKD